MGKEQNKVQRALENVMLLIFDRSLCATYAVYSLKELFDVDCLGL